MNAASLVTRLEAFAHALAATVADIRPEDARWKPPSGAWSILEVVNHLADEEIEDFRARLRSVFDDPSKPLPPIDPEGWARDRRYNDRDLGESVGRFVRERGNSIAWLRSLESPDWNLAFHHAKFGALPAGGFLASWTAHDALHLRQIAKRLYELAARDGEPFSVAYAGEWRA